MSQTIMSVATPITSRKIKSCSQLSDSHASGYMPPLPARLNSLSTQLAKPLSQLSMPFTTESAKLFDVIIASLFPSVRAGHVVQAQAHACGFEFEL